MHGKPQCLNLKGAEVEWSSVLSRLNAQAQSRCKVKKPAMKVF